MAFSLPTMTATDDSSPFEVLGVSETATKDEIRRAYRRQVLRYHPDRNPDDPAARETFLVVQEAYRRLDAKEPGVGFDAERVVAEMQRAAQEVERRRTRVGEGGRAWQQVQVALDRPRADLYAAVLRTPRAILGITVGVGLTAALWVGLPLVVALVGPHVGWSGSVPGWLALGVGVTLGLAVAVRACQTAELPPWAVQTHWQGLRDLRWDVMLSWSEIRGIDEGERTLDLALSPGAVKRLRALVPDEAFASPGVYRLPLADASRLAPILRAQLKG